MSTFIISLMHNVCVIVSWWYSLELKYRSAWNIRVSAMIYPLLLKKMLFKMSCSIFNFLRLTDFRKNNNDIYFASFNHESRKGNKHRRAGLTPAQRGGGAILYTHTAPSLLLTEALLVSNRRLICFTFMYKFLSRVIAKAIATYIRLMCVSVCVWVSVCCQYRVFFAYRQWTDGCIFMIFTHMIDIDDIVKLSKGQGHGVKGQIHGCV